MRIWNVNPELMCREHILGEHLECHMFIGCINKNKNIKGYIKNGLVEIHNLKQRHNQLAEEIKKRGYKHKSPLPKFRSYRAGKINKFKSINDLKNRCKECANNHSKTHKGGKRKLD